jgi:hypothetical protein
MMVWIPGKRSCDKGLATRLSSSPAINEQALGRIVAGFKGGFVFISEDAKPRCAFVHYAFRGSSQTVLSHCSLRHIRMVRTKIGRRAWHTSATCIGRG